MHRAFGRKDPCKRAGWSAARSHLLRATGVPPARGQFTPVFQRRRCRLFL